MEDLTGGGRSDSNGALSFCFRDFGGIGGGEVFLRFWEIVAGLQAMHLHEGVFGIHAVQVLDLVTRGEKVGRFSKLSDML